jgi:ParB-like chromosome segregation protein Spo0J
MLETPITLACKAWRGVLPVHSACEIIPAYSDAELIDLGRKIKAADGMKLPIIVLVRPDGTYSLLDGRSRLDALVHVGIKFEIKVIDGHVVIDAPEYDIPAPIEIVPDASFNAIAFVLSINLHRRHITNEKKRAIIKKVIEAQPNLSDNAVAKMAGVSDKTVKVIRQEINVAANSEFRISGDRVEATGRKARGRKPGQVKETSIADQKSHADTLSAAPAIKPVEAISTTPTDTKVSTEAPVVPIATSAKNKPTVVPNAFNAAEILAAARRVEEVLRRPVSAPNYEDAFKKIKHVIDLLLKTVEPAVGTPARAA